MEVLFLIIMSMFSYMLSTKDDAITPALPPAKRDEDPFFNVSLFYKKLEACENATIANDFLLETAKAGSIKTDSVLEHALSILVHMRMRPFTCDDVQNWFARATLSFNGAAVNAMLLRLNKLVAPIVFRIKEPTKETHATFAPFQENNIRHAPVFLPPGFNTALHHCGAPNLHLPEDEHYACLAYFSNLWNGNAEYVVQISTEEKRGVLTRREWLAIATHTVNGMNSMAEAGIDGFALQYLLRSNLHYTAFEETLTQGMQALKFSSSPSWVQTSLLEDATSSFEISVSSYQTALSSVAEYNFAHFLNSELRALQKSLIPLYIVGPTAVPNITKEEEFSLNVYSCGFVCFLADLFTPHISLGTAFLHEYMTLFSENLYVPEGEHIPTLFAKSYHAFADIATGIYEKNENPILFLLVFAKTFVNLVGKNEDIVQRWLPVMASTANVFDICNRILQLDTFK